jgi:hypothetical protein
MLMPSGADVGKTFVCHWSDVVELKYVAMLSARLIQAPIIFVHSTSGGQSVKKKMQKKENGMAAVS